MQAIFVPSQRNHEIDTLKHIESISSDEPVRTNDDQMRFEGNAHDVLCYDIASLCFVLGQVKLTLIVYA